MTIFIQRGDEPLSSDQVQMGTQAYIDSEWPAWKRERSIRLGDGNFNDYMDSIAADTDANRAANAFNVALAEYRAALTRLAAPVVDDPETPDAADREAAQATVDSTDPEVAAFHAESLPAVEPEAELTS
jgi:hypothetical protein